jgi:hypothetical protein
MSVSTTRPSTIASGVSYGSPYCSVPVAADTNYVTLSYFSKYCLICLRAVNKRTYATLFNSSNVVKFKKYNINLSTIYTRVGTQVLDNNKPLTSLTFIFSLLSILLNLIRIPFLPRAAYGCITVGTVEGPSSTGTSTALTTHSRISPIVSCYNSIYVSPLIREALYRVSSWHKVACTMWICLCQVESRY